MRALVTFAGSCIGRQVAWRAMAACGRGRWAGLSVESAAELVRVGLKCMRRWSSEDGDEDGDDSHIIRLSASIVGNVLFHSQAAAANADLTDVNATVQHWLRYQSLSLAHTSSSASASSPTAILPSQPSPPLHLSIVYLFALQNLAANSHIGIFISSSVRPSHILPLILSPPLSRHSAIASSYAAGNACSRDHILKPFSIQVFTLPPSILEGLLSNMLRAHPDLCSAYAASPLPQAICTVPTPPCLPYIYHPHIIFLPPQPQALVQALASAAAAGGDGMDSSTRELLEEALLSAVAAFAVQVT